jgi:hypothetical protein
MILFPLFYFPEFASNFLTIYFDQIDPTKKNNHFFCQV